MGEPLSDPLDAAADARGRDPLQLAPDLLRRLLRARDRIDARSHEAWPVTRLARVSHVSPAHFARLFRLAFGIPPHRYLLARRIERAQALLRDGDAPIIAIAYETGWLSLGSFGRTFRDITGDSPGVARAKARRARRELAAVPACVLMAAQRPDLRGAVSRIAIARSAQSKVLVSKTLVAKLSVSKTPVSKGIVSKRAVSEKRQAIASGTTRGPLDKEKTHE